MGLANDLFGVPHFQPTEWTAPLSVDSPRNDHPGTISPLRNMHPHNRKVSARPGTMVHVHHFAKLEGVQYGFVESATYFLPTTFMANMQLPTVPPAYVPCLLSARSTGV